MKLHNFPSVIDAQLVDRKMANYKLQIKNAFGAIINEKVRLSENSYSAFSPNNLSQSRQSTPALKYKGKKANMREFNLVGI